MDKLATSDPKYGALDIEIFDEQERPDIADTYNYYGIYRFYNG